MKKTTWVPIFTLAGCVSLAPAFIPHTSWNFVTVCAVLFTCFVIAALIVGKFGE